MGHPAVSSSAPLPGELERRPSVDQLTAAITDAVREDHPGAISRALTAAREAGLPQGLIHRAAAKGRRERDRRAKEGLERATVREQRTGVRPLPGREV